MSRRYDADFFDDEAIEGYDEPAGPIIQLVAAHTRFCVRCGCTNDAPCFPPCAWVTDKLCSNCVGIERFT